MKQLYLVQASNNGTEVTKKSSARDNNQKASAKGMESISISSQKFSQYQDMSKSSHRKHLQEKNNAFLRKPAQKSQGLPKVKNFEQRKMWRKSELQQKIIKLENIQKSINEINSELYDFTLAKNPQSVSKLANAPKPFPYIKSRMPQEQFKTIEN